MPTPTQVRCLKTGTTGDDPPKLVSLTHSLAYGLQRSGKGCCMSVYPQSKPDPPGSLEGAAVHAAGMIYPWEQDY